MSINHHAVELWDQFVICDGGPCAAPEGFVTTSIGGCFVARHPGVRLHPLSGRDGRPIGFVIGKLVTHAGLVADGAGFTAELGDDRAAGEWLDAKRGRFVLVRLTDDGPRVYLDSGGTLSAVFRGDKKLVASTTTLANYDRLDAFVAERTAAGGLAANQFYPAGLTGDANTSRLLPNHVLDLRRGTQSRYWPSEPLAIVRGEPAAEELAKEAARELCNTIAAMTTAGVVHVGLTAGRDSRVILAAAKAVLGRVAFHTFDYRDPAKAGDTDAAVALAKSLELNHRTFELREPTAEMKFNYRLRTGFDANAGKACDFFDAWERYLPRDAVTANGYCGEVGRAFYYKFGVSRTRDSAASLLKRMGLPHEPRNLDAVAWWLSNVPPFCSPATVLDLAYWEHRAGCWALPQMYGAAASELYMVPMGTRPVLARLMRFSELDRRHNRVPERLVAAAWSQAAAMPYRDKPSQCRSVVTRLRSVAGRLLRTVRRGR